MYTDKDIKQKWYSMLGRCGKAKNYEDVEICEEWKNFENFKEWFKKNMYGTKQFKLELDKDLFGQGKKIYSPETCCLIPKGINLLISSCTSRSRLLPGVTYNEKAKTFKTSIIHATIKKSKTFKTEEEAFQFYKTEKEKIIKITASAYDFLIPKHIYEALMNYEIKPVRGEWQDGFSRNFPVYK